MSDEEPEESRVRAYSSAEEMFADMDARERAANAGVLPKQFEITWGSYFLKIDGVGREQIPIFCKVDTIDEIVSKNVAAGASEEEVEEYETHYPRMYKRGYRYGEHFSVVCPEGEWGSSHIIGCWPITEEDYKYAEQNGWWLSPEAYTRIQHEMEVELAKRGESFGF